MTDDESTDRGAAERPELTDEELEQVSGGTGDLLTIITTANHVDWSQQPKTISQTPGVHLPKCTAGDGVCANP